MNKYVAPVAEQIELQVVDVLMASTCPLDLGGESWDEVEGQAAVNHYTPV